MDAETELELLDYRFGKAAVVFSGHAPSPRSHRQLGYLVGPQRPLRVREFLRPCGLVPGSIRSLGSPGPSLAPLAGPRPRSWRQPLLLQYSDTGDNRVIVP